MASVFLDGFDKYGQVGTTSTVGILNTWLSQNYTSIGLGGANGALSLVSSLNGVGGAALSFFGGSSGVGFTSIVKQLAPNMARCIGGFRFSIINAAAIHGIVFRDLSLNQFAITLNTDLTISWRSGGATSSTGQTVAAPSLALSSIHYLEWDVTIGAASPYNVYLDGALIMSGTGNSKAGSTNSYVNSFSIGNQAASNSGPQITIDDLYIFDGTTSFCNAPLLTSPVVETKYPSSDAQTQFTNGASLLGLTANITNSSNAPGANELVLVKVVPGATVNITGINAFTVAASATAKFKPVIYADSGGSPNGQARIAVGNETIGCTTTQATMTFAAPVSLTGGTTYWIGYITDTSIAVLESSTATTGVKAVNTYTAGAPATCPTVTVGQVAWEIWGVCSGSTVNWVSENRNPTDGDNSYIFSSTAGNEDLYHLPALITVPTNIYTVAAYCNARKSDSGARTLDIRCKSGATDSAGSNPGIALGTSYFWLASEFDTDPNTGAAWTNTAFGNATFGPKVAT